MRIIYDDTMQSEFVSVKLPNFLLRYEENPEELESIAKYDYGMTRIQVSLLKEQLNQAVKDCFFEIGNDVTHANGIGNNCRYPVYYTANPDELQICCYISINKGMYGEAYMYCDDYNKKRIGSSYEINYRCGVIEE